MTNPIEIFTLDSKNIRITDVNNQKYASVYDVVQCITGNKNVRDVYSRLKNSNPEIVAKCDDFKFDGKNQKMTPIANAQTIMEIIFLLPGKKAAKFRECGAKALLVALDPDKHFQEDLTEKCQELIENNSSNDFFSPGILTNAYSETYIYIRMQLPPDYIKQKINNIKKLTIDNVKFGITFSLRSRSGGYNKDDGDDGYFKYAFSMHNRTYADIIERILKLNFKDITLFGSNEYIDSTKLASILNIDFDSSSYESYELLVNNFYIYIVKLIRTLWSKEYSSHYGYQFNLEGCGANEKISTNRVEINENLAKEMGIIERPDLYKPQVARIDPKKFLISRDLITGVEIEYKNINLAAKSAKISPTSLKRTFVDKPRQCNGCHWRSIGKKYWVPPENFLYNKDGFEINTKGYICGIKGGICYIFESMTSASNILNINRRTLSSFINTEKKFNDYLWSDLPVTEWGTWHKITEKIVLKETEPVGIIDKEKNSRCNGQIIRRNLKTGEETVYKSKNKAALHNGTHGTNLFDNYVDKPRIFHGMSFRTFDSKTFWNPPQYLEFDFSQVYGPKCTFVTCTFPNGTIKMYPSISVAAEIESLPKGSISGVLDTDRKYKDCIWKKAFESEYSVFSPVQFIPH
jgi:hypothetical protein